MSDFKLSPRARADMIDIWRYSAGRWGDDLANRYIRQIDGVFAAVVGRPAMGRACDDIRPGYFRVAAGSHMVFYRKIDTGIFVIRVLHQSMDFERHL